MFSAGREDGRGGEAVQGRWCARSWPVPVAWWEPSSQPCAASLAFNGSESPETGCFHGNTLQEGRPISH